MYIKVDLGSFDKFEIEYLRRHATRHDDEEVDEDADDDDDVNVDASRHVGEEGDCEGKGYDYIVPGNAHPRLHDFDCDCDSRLFDILISAQCDARQMSKSKTQIGNANVNYLINVIIIYFLLQNSSFVRYRRSSEKP